MIYLLNTKKKIVGVLDNNTPFSCPFFEDSHIENIETAVHSYEFSMPANHEMAEQVISNGYVIITDLDNKLQMFQIKDIDETSSIDSYTKKVYCEHIAIPELLGRPLRPVKLPSTTLKNAMDSILSGTGWKLGVCEYDTSEDFTVDDYTTVLEGIHKLMELFGAEIEFEVIIQHGEIKDQLVNVVVQRGEVTDKLFSYGKDLMEVTRTENSEDVITALIGVGKGDANGSRITLANYLVTPESGFEKPQSADWIGNETAIQRFSPDGEHIYGIFSDDTATNQVALYKNTLAELKKRMIPQLTYSTRVAVLERLIGWEAEKIRVGDTVIIKDDTFTPVLALEARVKEVKRSYTNPENDGVILGDYRPIKLASMAGIRKIQAKISAKEEYWNTKTLSIIIVSGNGHAFKNGEGMTRLTAKLLRGTNEEDVEGTIYTYKWYKSDKYGYRVASWGGWGIDYKTGKILTVMASEIVEKNTFTCEVEMKPIVY